MRKQVSQFQQKQKMKLSMMWFQLMVCKSIAIGCLMSWYRMYIHGRYTIASVGYGYCSVLCAFHYLIFNVVVKWELIVIGRGRVSQKQTNVFGIFSESSSKANSYCTQGWRRHRATILRTPLHKGETRRIWTSSSKSWWKIVSLKVPCCFSFHFCLANGVTYRHRGIVSLLRSGKPQGPPCSFNAKSARPGTVTLSSPRCAPINLPRCLRVRYRHADLRKLLRNIYEFCGVSTIDHFVPCFFSLFRGTEWWREQSDLVGLPATRFAFQFRTSVSMSDDGSVFVTLPDIKISCAVWTCHCTCCCVWQFTRTTDL